MPIYVYACACGNQFEKRSSFAESAKAAKVRCPTCQKLATRVFTNVKAVNSSQTKPSPIPTAPTKYYPW